MWEPPEPDRDLSPSSDLNRLDIHAVHHGSVLDLYFEGVGCEVVEVDLYAADTSRQTLHVVGRSANPNVPARRGSVDAIVLAVERHSVSQQIALDAGIDGARLRGQVLNVWYETV